MTKHLGIVVGVGLAAVGLVAAARYAGDAGATSSRAPGSDPGPVPTSGAAIRFIRNPLPITPFSVQDLAGATIDTSTWRGKVTLLNFWATWCPPCRAEIPDLVALQKKYGDRLQIIGIADDASADQVREFMTSMEMNYPSAMMNSALRVAFRVRALPTTYVLDREGRVVQKHIGQLNARVTEEEVRALLDLPIESKVEKIDDREPTTLSTGSHATEVPGVDLTGLTADQKKEALLVLNSEHCICGCKLTLAECRINDPSCQISPPLAKVAVDRIRNSP